MNASLAWRPSDSNLELRIWARKLLQLAYRAQPFDLPDPAFRSIIDEYGPPRTVGTTLSL